MVQIEKFKTLEEEILQLLEKSKDTALSIEEIFGILTGKGRALILILLCLPFCQPIQIPGFSTPFGLMIAFFGLRLAFGKHLWLPERLLTKSISSQILQKICEKALHFVRTIKPWLHPRLNWVCHSMPMRVVNGLLISILGVILALPLPIPLSNLTAAWSILVISLGILEDDGLLVLLGYLVTAMTFAFFAVIGLSLEHLFLNMVR